LKITINIYINLFYLAKLFIAFCRLIVLMQTTGRQRTHLVGYGRDGATIIC